MRDASDVASSHRQNHVPGGDVPPQMIVYFGFCRQLGYVATQSSGLGRELTGCLAAIESLVLAGLKHLGHDDFVGVLQAFSQWAHQVPGA
jgi:hypothetical protein